MTVLILREADVRTLIDMSDALAAVETAFLEQARGTGINVPRQRVHQPYGMLHMLGAALVERGYWGSKVYTSTREGTRFLINLYDLKSGVLLAILEADYLGTLRTGAASGVATRLLARSDAHVMALFGSGSQAMAQLQAVAAVRQLSEVRLYSRTPARREAAAAQMRDELGIEVHAVASPSDAIRGADIITTITTSRTPVFDGKELESGVHINAAGANALARTEIDRTTVRRADVIVTDDLVQAQRESGDLVMAAEQNALSWASVRHLADVVAGMTSGRRSAEEITLFASHGIALWDIALAAIAYERAQERHTGDTIKLGS